ncbi:tyrosine-protein kinase BAZ1B isoform X1 [Callorhinchus milii]|uniref:Tyrosine-protein kinase BAZ1B n=1 Tax=Callorhinchus milii TaxID=7868 RepID=A0A4W3IJ75_CALMI|nr:tyrosine-protein kinase BAZ1B isoform X1 [Callorhinchus milii]
MAPLLGRKPFPLLKPLADLAPGETVFVIEHSGECFRSQEEYDIRLARYEERIWTCKSTGSSQLTHKEAWEEEQEVTELLKEEYPVWFEKPVLEMVHHNTISLDKLVDKTWMEIMTKFAVGEQCEFQVGENKILQVKVVKVHPLEPKEEESCEKKTDGTCDSPSSDKENSSQAAQNSCGLDVSNKVEENKRDCNASDRARRSPRKLPTSLKKEERKWVPPKFLPYKYDVKLEKEDKIISNVPADSLVRSERPPNKEILRYFIRHNSLRMGMGENVPWVVEDLLVEKYSLPSKFNDFLLSPYKTLKWTEDDEYMIHNPIVQLGKRKGTGTPEGKSSKKAKGEDGKEKTKKKYKDKKIPLSPPLSPTLWGHVHVKKAINGTGKLGTPVKMNSGIPHTPKRSPEQELEEVMKIVTPTKLNTNFHIPKKGSHSGSGTPSRSLKDKMKKDKMKRNDKGSLQKVKLKNKSGPKSKLLNGQKSPSKSKSPKKGLKTPKTKMKQMTLFEMAKSGTSKTAKTSKGVGGTPRSASKPQKHLPPLALQLIRYYKDNKGKEEKKSAVSAFITRVAKVLSAEDRARMPEEIGNLVQKRYEMLEHKRKWALMSQEQRADYLKKKREELKEKLKEKAKERREKEMQLKLEKQRRYEDQALAGKNLPPLKLVDTPEGLPNTLFGDVAMVVEFLSCYAGLLMPDDQYPITAVSLMEALTSEKGGFLYLNRVLVILLQTLLQDEIAEDYRELGMKLSEIPLTLHSASELVRLCMRKSDVQEESQTSVTNDESKETIGFDDNEVEDEFLEKLETAEFFELSPEEKVMLLTALCHRILMTYSVQDHMEASHHKSAELWKERLAMQKEENDRKKAEKLKRKELGEAKKREPENTKLVEKKKPEKKKEFDKKMEVDKGGSDLLTDVNGSEDLISAIKSRRLLAQQAKREKEVREKQEKERLEKEVEEEKARKHKAAAEKVFQEGIAKSKLVLRRLPIGTDRNHNRYWLFCDLVPGLYVEKGWVHDSVDYSFTLPEAYLQHEEDRHSKSNDEDSIAESSLNDCGHQGSLQTSEACIEISVPKQGQNLWFLCDTQKELDELLDCLHPQGFRESALKERLQKKYQDILHSIYFARKPNLGLKSCNGHQELLNYLRTDLIEVATRLQKGGLGYMDNCDEFEERVRSMESLKDFGECVITLQECIIKKFLQGFMAPKQKRKKAGEEVKVEEVDEEKKLVEEAKVASAVEKWKSAIHEAQTFSRMHVLLGMLDACIKWDMSAENARCKVCRKKGEDDTLIRCDECNKAFHLFCLRPALYVIPDGEWLCPACQPATARRGTRDRNYAEEEEDEDKDEEEDEEEEEEEDDDEDYEEQAVTAGPRLRPRKVIKAKPVVQTVAPRRGRPPGKKKSTQTHVRNTRHKASPVNELDIDELVRHGSRRQNMELAKCEEILNKLIRSRYSWPFREPVTSAEAEDYLEIISNPMDLQTMQSKCTWGGYKSVEDFLEDIMLVFGNAEQYNEEGSQVLVCLEKTERCFASMLQKRLPGYTYKRGKPRRRGTRKRVKLVEIDLMEEDDDEDYYDSDAESSEHSTPPRKRRK